MSVTTLRLGAWADLQRDAAEVRHEVFVQEQNVPVEIEMDEQDQDSLHAVVFDTNGMAIATGRLLPSSHIGRMAVKSAYRGQGVGAQVLLALMAAAKQRGERCVYLSAQLQALSFYSKYGFEAYGEVYQDADIDHRMMRCELSL